MSRRLAPTSGRVWLLRSVAVAVAVAMWLWLWRCGCGDVAVAMWLWRCGCGMTGVWLRVWLRVPRAHRFDCVAVRYSRGWVAVRLCQDVSIYPDVSHKTHVRSNCVNLRSIVSMVACPECIVSAACAFATLELPGCFAPTTIDHLMLTFCHCQNAHIFSLF
jgi:hypothetical protein